MHTLKRHRHFERSATKSRNLPRDKSLTSLSVPLRPILHFCHINSQRIHRLARKYTLVQLNIIPAFIINALVFTINALYFIIIEHAFIINVLYLIIIEHAFIINALYSTIRVPALLNDVAALNFIATDTQISTKDFLISFATSAPTLRAPLRLPKPCK